MDYISSKGSEETPKIPDKTNSKNPLNRLAEGKNSIENLILLYDNN